MLPSLPVEFISFDFFWLSDDFAIEFRHGGYGGGYGGGGGMFRMHSVSCPESPIISPLMQMHMANLEAYPQLQSLKNLLWLLDSKKIF